MTAVSKVSKSAAQTILNAMSLEDLLGTCVPYVAPTQAAKAPRVSRPLMTTEEKKAARNAAQKLLRSTPEGKAYANAASKKSIALKKARMEAELAKFKSLAAVVESEEQNADLIDAEVAAAEVVAVKVKKAKKPSKTSVEVLNAEDAPF